MMGASMYQRLAQFYARFTLKFFPIFIILGTLILYPAFEGSKQLFSHIDTDLINLLPEDYESVQYMHKIRDKVKGIGNLNIMVEGDDRESILKFLHDLTPRLLQEPDISEAYFEKPGYDFLNDHKILYVELEDLRQIRDKVDRRIQQEKLGDLFISFDEEDPKSFDDILKEYEERYAIGARTRYFENDTGTLFLLNVQPAGSSSDFNFSKRVSARVEIIVQELNPAGYEGGLKIHYAGNVRTKLDEYTSLMTDLKRAGVVAGGGIVLLMIVLFLNPFSLLFLFLPLILGLLVTFGITNEILGRLNTVTSFMFAVLMGLGIDFGIHMLSRYLEEKRKGASLLARLETILTTAARASLTSAVTTAVAFFFFMRVDFKGFSEFGMIAGMGILVVIASYILFMPPLLVAGEKLRLLPIISWKGALILWEKVRWTNPRRVLGVMVLVTLASLMALPWVGFEYNYGNLRAVIPASEVAREKQKQIQKRRGSPAAVILQTQEEADLLKTVIQKKAAEEGSILDVAKTYYDLAPTDQAKKMVVIREIQTLLDDDVVQKLVKGENKEKIDEFQASLEVTPFAMENVPDELKNFFAGNKEIPGTLGLIFTLPPIELHDGRNAIQFAHAVQEIKTEDKTFHASSDSIVFANVLEVMLKDTRIALPLAFGAVLFFLFLDFRSLRKVIAIAIPWVSGWLWMILGMALLDIQLNFFNVFVPAAVFGMGIDYSVHMFHRYEESPNNIFEVIHTTGFAVLISGLTSIIGFMGLAVAHHRGLQSLGILAIMGITGCLITSLFLFPSVMQVRNAKNNVSKI